MIRVELKDGTICQMAKKAFYIFLAQNKVSKFERSDGWVDVAEVPLRSRLETDSYHGQERRCA